MAFATVKGARGAYSESQIESTGLLNRYDPPKISQECYSDSYGTGRSALTSGGRQPRGPLVIAEDPRGDTLPPSILLPCGMVPCGAGGAGTNCRWRLETPTMLPSPTGPQIRQVCSTG